MGVGLEAKTRLLREATGGSETTGWMHDEVCWLIFGLIRFYRPTLVIQTGHLWGKSALVACEALEQCCLDRGEMGDPDYAKFVKNHRPKKGHGRVISVDPAPDGVPNADAGVKLLQEWYPRFMYQQIPSGLFFEAAGPQFDGERIFGIVDGDHSVEGAMQDLNALADAGAGMIVLDDTSWIPELAGLAGEMEDYQSTEFPAYNGITLLTRVK